MDLSITIIVHSSRKDSTRSGHAKRPGFTSEAYISCRPSSMHRYQVIRESPARDSTPWQSLGVVKAGNEIASAGSKSKC